MKIIVITTTFNRSNLLNRLYLSLEKQDDMDFEWCVVDDGSTDDTSKYIETIQKISSFKINYLHKKNSGKSKSLNYAFENYTNEENAFFLVIDSDDFLFADGISKVKEAIEIYNDENIGSIFFKYRFEDPFIQKRVVVYENDFIGSRNEHDRIHGKYDGAIGYFSNVVEKYRFPEYENEKYIAPTALQNLISKDYKIAFTNIEIGVAEYQTTGISKLGRSLRIKNPLGMMFYSLQQTEVNETKNMILFNAYRNFTSKSDSELHEMDLVIDSNFIIKLSGFLVYKYWKYKYDK